MPLSICIEFLVGRYTATNLHKYKKPEWPPHPGRLFMAMVSSYFNGDKKQDEKEALEYLEQCKPPSIYYESDKITTRDNVETFVPINDELKSKFKGESRLTTLEIPLDRLRQPRMFPTTITGYDPLYFVWDDVVIDHKHLNALKILCSRIHRLGHSSSFVSITVNDSEIDIQATMIPNKLGDIPIRWISKGLSNKLEQVFEMDGEQSNKNKQSEKNELYYVKKARLNAISLPEFRYSKKLDETMSLEQGHFSDMVILPITSNKNLNPLHTKDMVQSLRNKIQKNNVPEYVSGLDVDGNPSKSPHVAIVPLAFTGNRYADGLIRGMAIIFPRKRETESEKSISDALYGDKTSTDIEIENKKFGNVKLSLETYDPIKTLETNTWKRHSKTWATTTPIVLDRVPHVKKNISWWDKVEEIVSKSCRNQDIPEPKVSVSNIAFLRGVPNANKFPKYAQNKTQVHALLQFEKEIKGPLLIGAGRYNGYGLCRPWGDKRWSN